MASPFAMIVPKGGSDCAKCKYNRSGVCGNTDFIQDSAGHKKSGDNRFIDPDTGAEVPGDQYCCNYFDWDRPGGDALQVYGQRLSRRK